MNILLGVPDRMHRELADLEIEGIKTLIPNCNTIHYGPYDSKENTNRIFNTIRNAFKIRKALFRNEYDLLFLNTAFDRNAILRDSITLLILKFLKTKIFLKFHGTDLLLLNNINWWQKKLVIWLFNNANGLGMLSSEEKDAFIKKGFSEKKIFVVKNPIDPSLYIKDEKFKSALGLPDKTFVFIFCGRFIPQKGLMDTLNALLILKKEERLPVHLICIGDGPDMKMARSFVEDHMLIDQVTFTGFIPEKDIRPYYSNADALVFPTYHQEGFPMVVFQSLAAGLPIITTRIRAAADYLKEPKNVLWVEPKNPISIEFAMKKLLINHNVRIQMCNNNKLLSEQFTTNNNAIEYNRIFKKIL